MPEQLATCPNCGHEFEVADVLTDSIREQLRRELEADLVKRRGPAFIHDTNYRSIDEDR